MDKDKLRGVNLGGWLVLERWITSSLFEGTSAHDEFSLLQEPGGPEKVERHRRDFITEADFRWLAENGANAVRIPVGYWMLDGDDPYVAGISYLDWAMNMAETYRLKVLIDLHAAKGSQNGHDHSGRIGRVDWFRYKGYRQHTIEVLMRLARRYHDAPALWGIELLNEPRLGLIRFFLLRRFYARVYRELIKILRPGTRIVFSDAFAPVLFSGALRRHEDFPPIMDIHWYHPSTMKIGRYFMKLQQRRKDITRFQSQQSVIIGEWSGMLSQEALAGLSEDEKVRLQVEHIDRQLEAYAPAVGWFYWTYKTEHGGIWSFRQQVEDGHLLLTK